jgi:hypothetical protein
MKMLAVAVSVSLTAFAVSAAYAECPATGLQDAANIYISTGLPTIDADAIAARTDALAKACASSPHVQKAAAMTFHALTARAGDDSKAFDRAVSAWTYLEAMRKVRGPNEAPAMVMVDGQATEIDVYAADKIEEGLLVDVLIAEVNSGKRYPDHRPLQPGEKPRACGQWDALDVQNAAWFVRKNPKTDIPPALDFIERAYAACAATIDKGVNPRILALRAMALYGMVAENPKRPDAVAMLDKAQADSKRYFQIVPNGDGAYWSTYDRDRLDELTAKVRLDNTPLPPEADWFKPGNPENPAVVRAIAAKLDDAWAIDAPLGVGGAYKTYRGVINALYTKAMTSGNMVPARHAVALAAQGHSDGSMRRPETKELPTPPEFLWNWIDTKPAQ